MTEMAHDPILDMIMFRPRLKRRKLMWGNDDKKRKVKMFCFFLKQDLLF
jgi:hypothetical protein